LKLKIRRTTQFKRDVRKVLRRRKDIERLLSIIEALAEEKKYPPNIKTIRSQAIIKTNAIVMSNPIGF
jgi:mRNA-degrading endonuclease YafQ of YafQ-DinJ toxin-antitoxin module